MIIDSIQACISAINQKQDALKNKQSYEEYQKALASLSAECLSLERSLDTIDSISKQGITDVPLLDEVLRSELIEAVDDCGTALESGHLSRETVQVFGSKAKQLQRDLSLSWKTCASQYAEGITGYLGIIQGFAENPKEVSDLRTRIESAATGDPSPASAKKLSADVTQANAIISKFSLKPEIEAFLKKVSAKQATVADLTPAVLNWLESQHLVSKLKIAF